MTPEIQTVYKRRIFAHVTQNSDYARCRELWTRHWNFGVPIATIHFGPCEEDGSRVWELEVSSGRHPMSKRTWDIWFVKVIKREINQAVALVVGSKCR